MATYYIREIPCQFAANVAVDQFSLEGYLESYTDTDKYVRTVPDNFLVYDGQDIFVLSNSHGVTVIAKASSSFNKIPVSGRSIFWNDKWQQTGPIGFNGTAWSNAGWTNPDVDKDTWKQELVDFIEDRKDSVSAWGQDNSEINIYIIVYKFANSVNTYFPIFYKGNDPYRDETKTPTP